MNWENGAGLNRHLPSLTESQKKKIRNGKKIEVCTEMREGWTGDLPFYIFWCGRCENFSYDYAHGYPHNQYLNCHRCSGWVDFRPWWVDWVELWHMIKFIFALSFRRK